MTPHRDRLLAGDYEPGKAAGNPLDSMTKAELADEAARRGLTYPSDATKADLRALLEG